MRTAQLKAARLAAGLTQAQLARRLRTSQAHVSLLERGLRNPSTSLGQGLAKVLKLPPTARPLRVGKHGLDGDPDRAAKALATLGYPGFAYLGRSRTPLNPAEVLLRTLGADRVDVRLLEALPWLLLHFEDFDHAQTVRLAHRHSLQNRLGFVVALARSVAQRNPKLARRLPELNELLALLEPLRLAREDDLGQPPRSERFREWVRENRSEAAAHWNLLTDLGTRHLPHDD